MSKGFARVAVLVLVAGVPPGARAATNDPPRIQHERLTCVPSDGNARVKANISAGSPLTSVRLYFRAAQWSRDYYLEMRRGDAGLFWAVLPVPESGTKAVQYRIVTRDGDGFEASTDSIVVPTDSNCTVNLTDEEKRYANNLVIGLTNDQQNAIPDGFKCVGLVSKITVNGELRPNDECRKVPAALWITGGAAALVGGGVIISNPGGGGGPPVSSPRPVPAAPR